MYVRWRQFTACILGVLLLLLSLPLSMRDIKGASSSFSQPQPLLPISRLEDESENENENENGDENIAPATHPAPPTTAGAVGGPLSTGGISTTGIISDVGRFTSGAEVCGSDCQAWLELTDADRRPSTTIVPLQSRAVSPCAYPLPDGLCVYYGDLHSHTGYSDGQGTPQQAYRTARDNGLDFLAITDHAEQLSSDEWADILTQAQAATQEGQFVALRGFEWTSNHGHLNIFNTVRRVRANDSRYNTLTELYAWLSDPAQIHSIAQFNHPFYPSDPFDGWQYDAPADAHVNLIETHNGYYRMIAEYHDALMAGWHVGVASNSDTHQANWGERKARTGILAPGLTLYHVLEALRTRRTFSTDDDNFILAMRANGFWMGAVIPVTPVHFDFYAFDPDPDDRILTVTLLQNGEPFWSRTVGTTTFTASLTLSDPPPVGTWWYLKAVQQDGEEAYSSPIWVWQPSMPDGLVTDDLQDVGGIPSPTPTWQSADVWVRRQPDGERWPQNPLPGANNTVYVRVRNIGSQPLSDVDVYLYWSSPALGMVWPDDWQPVIQTPIRIPSIAAGQEVIVHTPWSLPDFAPPHMNLLARLVSSQDPIRYDGYPRWDNNLAVNAVHIVESVESGEIGAGAPATGSLGIGNAILALTNPEAEEQTVDLRFSSDSFPAEGRLSLSMESALFDRWMGTPMGSAVRGGTVYPVSRTVVITAPMDAAVYGLPLLARERSPVMLTMEVPPSAAWNVRVAEYVGPDLVGESLYTTPYGPLPRQVFLQATTDAALAGGHPVGITMTVLGAGGVPVADGTPVWLTATLGTLNADVVYTRRGVATATLRTGLVTGTATVWATANDIHQAVQMHIYPQCRARLNDGPVYATIQAAVDASTHPTDTIAVAGRCTGAHTRNGRRQMVYLDKTLTIRGGYAGVDGATWEWNPAHPTILDAEGQGRVFYITGGVSPTIEGLRVVGGDATGMGGGPANEDAGGGIYVNGATPRLWGNWLLTNTAESGGGIYLASADSVLSNNVIADNQGGGVVVAGGAAQMIHTTLARNGVGISLRESGGTPGWAVLTNTIIAGHTVGISVTAGNTATLAFTLWGDGDWRNETDVVGAGWVVTGTHNYQGDPAFVAPDAGDYHIGPGSAALDVGASLRGPEDMNGVGNVDDVDGEPRPMGRGADIGADELRVAVAVGKEATVIALPAGIQIRYTVGVTNTGYIPLHALITDTLPAHTWPGEVAGGTLLLPGGKLRWSPILTATAIGGAPGKGNVWNRSVVVTVETGYTGPLTNVLTAVTDEGATDKYTHTRIISPGLRLSLRAAPDPVEAGHALTYTLRATNTGNIALYIPITVTLPSAITTGTMAGGSGTSVLPGGTLTWSPVIMPASPPWERTIAVTVAAGYAGPLTCAVQAATGGGVADRKTHITVAFVRYPLYLPVTMRNFSPPTPCVPRLLAQVDVGPEPYRVALDPAGRRVFVAYAEGVAVIDADRFTVLTMTRPLTAAHGIAYDSDHRRLWVAGRASDRVIVLDSDTYRLLATLPAGDLPHDVAYNPANGYVYVSNYVGGTVGVYNSETLTRVVELTGFGEPAHIAVNPLTNKIYVANHRPNRGVFVIAGDTHIVRPIGTTLLDAYGVTVDTTRNLVYATGIAQGRICIIDGATDTQIGSLDMHVEDRAMWLRAILVNPSIGDTGHLMVVTSSNDGEQDRFLLIPNGWPEMGAFIPLNLPAYPQEGLALDPLTDRVWVTSVSSGVVSVIQDGEPLCKD